MKRFLAAVAVLDTVSFLAGLFYVIVNGEVPPTLRDAWQQAQTAALIILCILAIPAVILVGLIIRAQLAPPFGEQQ